jgi:hypothetical protein
MRKRGENKSYESISNGEFRPLNISRDVRDIFEIQAQQLGIINPYEAARDVLDRIEEVLETTPLSGDLFPDIENPFEGLPEINLGPISQGTLPNTAISAPSFIGSQNISIPNIVTQAQTFDNLYSEDDLGKAYLQKQIQKNRRTV